MKNRKNKIWNRYSNSDVAFCFYCRNILIYNEFSKHNPFGWDIEHLIPKSKGGKNNKENLVLVHCWCNKFRSNKDEVSYNEFKNNYEKKKRKFNEANF